MQEDVLTPEIPPTPDARGFFSKLFDLSFETFVTTSIIKVIYVILLVVAGLIALGIFVAMAGEGGAGVVLGLVLAPIAFILYTILSRVWMEVIIVMFRIAENTEIMAKNSRR